MSHPADQLMRGDRVLIMATPQTQAAKVAGLRGTISYLPHQGVMANVDLGGRSVPVNVDSLKKES